MLAQVLYDVWCCNHNELLYLNFSGGSREVKCYEDIAKFRDECGVSSIMLARAAQWNPSIFRAKGILTSPEVIKDYLKYVIVCCDY